MLTTLLIAACLSRETISSTISPSPLTNLHRVINSKSNKNYIQHVMTKKYIMYISMTDSNAEMHLHDAQCAVVGKYNYIYLIITCVFLFRGPGLSSIYSVAYRILLLSLEQEIYQCMY